MAESNNVGNDAVASATEDNDGDQQNVPGGGEADTAADQQQQPQQVHHTKVDKITALQDGVDSLSLAMFEALRGLRDAVAPESGNLGGANNPNNPNNNDNNGGGGQSSNNNNNSSDSFEEFYQSYINGDPETMSQVQKITSNIPRKREDFLRLHAKIEQQKDAELVQKLAETVLEKSADIDERVSALPGMHRTKAQQMKHIEDLIKRNQDVCEKLQDAYDRASERRDLVRKSVRDNTCASLGISVDDED